MEVRAHIPDLELRQRQARKEQLSQRVESIFSRASDALTAAGELLPADLFSSFPTATEERQSEKLLRELARGLSNEAADALGQELPTPIVESQEEDSGEQDSLTAATWEIDGKALPSWFRGTKNQVLARFNRLLDLAYSRGERRRLARVRRDVDRSYITYSNAVFRLSGESYHRGLREFIRSTSPTHPSNLEPNLGAWGRFLRRSMGPALKASAEGIVLDWFKARNLPLPPKRELNKMINQTVRDTLRDSRDLLQTVERFRGGFSTFDPTGLGHSTNVAQSLGQRMADRLERRIVQYGVDKGLLQPVKVWNTFSPDSRHAHLDGVERPLGGTFQLEPGRGSPRYYGPRDPEMDNDQGSLSRAYLTYRPTRKLAEQIAKELNKNASPGSPLWEWQEIISINI